jgi:hypothetical protein
MASFLDNLLYSAAFGAAPPGGVAATPANVLQSEIVALSNLASVLEKYDKTGDARALREWKAQTMAKSELLKAKTELLKAGIEGASRESVARTNASAKITAERIGAYKDLANAGYDRTYGAAVDRVMQDTASYPPGPETQKARSDMFVERLDPTQPGLHRALAQAERTFGPLTVSPANQERLASIRQTAAGQAEREKELDQSVADAKGGGGGSGSVASAAKGIAILEQDYDLGKQDSAADTAAKTQELKNLERVQSSYDSLSAKIFAADKLAQYGGMTEDQWKTVISSPRFTRFAREHGFEVGSVDKDGNVLPGRQDHRAVSAFIRAESGRPVLGTHNRMERTLVALDVPGGTTPEGYAWDDGKYRVGPDGAYLRPEDAPHDKASEHDDILLIDSKGNGYARDSAGAIYYLNPGSGTTSLMRTADGKWVDGNAAQLKKDVAAQEAQGLTWRPFADAAGGPPLSKDEVARRLSQDDGKGMETLTDDDALVKKDDAHAAFSIVDGGPQGSHKIYGRILPHKPSDDDDTIRLSTAGGVKVLHRGDGDVWQAEEDPSYTLPGGVDVLHGGKTRTTLREMMQANRGARDEAASRAASAPDVAPVVVDKAKKVEDAKAALVASMRAATPPKEAPLPPAPTDVEPGSQAAIDAQKQRRLDAVKAALVQTMQGNPTLPPGKTLPAEPPTPSAPPDAQQKNLVAALLQLRKQKAGG